MINVMVIGPQALWLTGLIELVKKQSQLNVLGHGSHDLIRRRVAEGEIPQVLLIDMTSHLSHGLGVIERYRRVAPQIRIVGLVAHSNHPALSRLLELGVKGLVTPACQSEEFVQAICCAARDEHSISSALAQSLAMARIPGHLRRFDSLTTREMEVALSLLEGKRMPAIAKQLNVSPKTIATYKYRIYEKLNVDTEVALLKLAIRSGLIELESDSAQTSLF